MQPKRLQNNCKKVITKNKNTCRVVAGMWIHPVMAKLAYLVGYLHMFESYLSIDCSERPLIYCFFKHAPHVHLHIGKDQELI